MKTMLAAALMIVCLAAVAPLLSSKGSAADATWSEHFSYVSEAINKINSIASKPDDRKNALEIANVACDMLIRLDRDPDLTKLVSTALGGVRGQASNDIQNLFQDLGSLDNFLEQELSLFKQVGIQPLSSIQALSAALSVGKQLKHGKVNSTQVIADIKSLKEKVCDSRNNLAEAEKWRERQLAILTGLSGVAFILADELAGLMTIGGAALAVDVSGAMGGALISKGVSAF